MASTGSSRRSGPGPVKRTGLAALGVGPSRLGRPDRDGRCGPPGPLARRWRPPFGVIEPEAIAVTTPAGEDRGCAANGCSLESGAVERSPRTQAAAARREAPRPSRAGGALLWRRRAPGCAAPARPRDAPTNGDRARRGVRRPAGVGRWALVTHRRDATRDRHAAGRGHRRAPPLERGPPGRRSSRPAPTPEHRPGPPVRRAGLRPGARRLRPRPPGRGAGRHRSLRAAHQRPAPHDRRWPHRGGGGRCPHRHPPPGHPGPGLPRPGLRPRHGRRGPRPHRARRALTPHRTGPNTTDGVRSAYILQYAPDGARVLEGDPSAPPVRTVPCADAERQLPLLVGGIHTPPPPLP